MNDYFVGAGAVLTAGPKAGIAGAALHAQTDASVARVVRAVLVDFESSALGDLSKVVVAGVGWNAAAVRSRLIEPLTARGACSLADVLETLSRGMQVDEIHIFSRWLPDELLTAGLWARRIRLVAHPLEAIRQAALVSGQSYTRLAAPFRAA
jgi:hypothetical protein